MACSRKGRRLLSRDLTVDDFVLRPLAKNATLDLSTPFRRHRLKDPYQGDVLEELLPRGTIGRAALVERLKGRGVRPPSRRPACVVVPPLVRFLSAAGAMVSGICAYSPIAPVLAVWNRWFRRGSRATV